MHACVYGDAFFERMLAHSWVNVGDFWPVENSNKNYKNFVQKVVDVSIFWEYYRDSS